MQIPDEVRLVIEGIGILGSAALIMTKLGRLGERFDNHGDKLVKLESAVEKMEETLQVVAVQKDQIQSIREAQQLNTKRTDETFTRVFAIMDRMQQR